MTDRLANLPGGVGVALVTLFRDGEVDIDGTTRLAARSVDRGVTSILVAGTTGEPWRLNVQDRIALVAAIKSRLPETPVFVGTGDPHAAKALEMTRLVAQARVADGLVVLAAADIPGISYYRQIRALAGDQVVLAYHLPILSAPGVAADGAEELPVEGIKDSSGDGDRLAELAGQDIAVYVGTANLLSLAGPTGTKGAILALANTVPELCIEAWNGDPGAQRQLFAVHQASLVDFPSRLKPIRG